MPPEMFFEVALLGVVLAAEKEAGISLLAFSGFPTKGGKAQVDLVAEKLGPIQKVARKKGWKLSKPKKGFLIRGTDEVGAIEQPISALAAKGINTTAADAVASGDGRYGMILWVKPKRLQSRGKGAGGGISAQTDPYPADLPSVMAAPQLARDEVQ